MSEELLALARRIYNAIDQGGDCETLINEFQEKVPFANVERLFRAELPVNELVEKALAPNSIPRASLSRAEMVELVERIIRVEGTESEIDAWIRTLEMGIPSPGISDLIFWSDLRTAEEIVEKALEYRPIQL